MDLVRHNTSNIFAVKVITVLAWLGIWVAIGSEPHLPSPSFFGYIAAARPLVPIMVLCLFLIWAVINAKQIRIKRWVWAFFGYCLILMISSFQNEAPFLYIYFPLCMIGALSVLVFVDHYIADPDEVHTLLTSVSLAILSLVLVIFTLRYFKQSHDVQIYSGYLLARFDERLPLPTGLARTAVCCGIFYFYLLGNRHITKPLFYLAAGACVALLAYYQARGAVFGVLMTFLVILLFASGDRLRFCKESLKVVFIAGALYIMMLCIAYLSWFLVDIFQSAAGAGAGTSAGTIKTTGMIRTLDSESFSSGRFEDWRLAIKFIADAPLFGFGSQADRLLLEQSVSNTLLYTLLSAGFIGTVCFFSVFILMAWQCLALLFRGGMKIIPDKITFFTSLALVSFLSARGVVESGYAVFGIDFMLVLPPLFWFFGHGSFKNIVNKGSVRY